MAPRFVILRHAETLVDLRTPASEWVLSNDGATSCKVMAKSGIFGDIDAIYSSSEQKAIQTSTPFAEELGLKIQARSGLRELERGTNHLSKEEYLASVECSLSFPPKIVEGWEHPELALSRFEKIMSSIALNGYERILVVSHGIVISLFMASLLSVREMTFARWKKLKFLSWGEIMGSTILRDII